MPLRAGRNLHCPGSTLSQCRLPKGPLSCCGTDVVKESRTCLTRTLSCRKHYNCCDSPWWHEGSVLIKNKKQNLTSFKVCEVGRHGLTSALHSLCRKLQRADTKQCIQILDDSICGAFSISFSPRVLCIQWLELPELCHRGAGGSPQASTHLMVPSLQC